MVSVIVLLFGANLWGQSESEVLSDEALEMDLSVTSDDELIIESDDNEDEFENSDEEALGWESTLETEVEEEIVDEESVDEEFVDDEFVDDEIVDGEIGEEMDVSGEMDMEMDEPSITGDDEFELVEEADIETTELTEETFDLNITDNEVGVSQVMESAEMLPSDPENGIAPLSDNVESLKQAVLDLNRDLLILEEELLFPTNTQVVVFISMDVGEFFQLDAVKLKIDDTLVASHLYTERQVDALFRGGVQRLYIGNIKSGSHEISAFFTGKGPSGRDYKRGARLTMEKGQEAKMLELRIVDSTAKLQPVFDIKEWQL